ncbi:MAG: hypothetical protein HGA54_01705 [Actinobacteria bacterium]|nr:hypothetical protein [Actinomycetota bacterium]
MKSYLKATNETTDENKYVQVHQGTVMIAKRCITGKLDSYDLTVAMAFIASEPEAGKLRGQEFMNALAAWCCEWRVDVAKEYTSDEIEVADADPLP